MQGKKKGCHDVNAQSQLVAQALTNYFSQLSEKRADFASSLQGIFVL